MDFSFVSMKREYAAEIIDWHYDEIYSFYDMTADDEDLEEFKNPENWKDCYFAVLNEKDELVGYFSIYFDEEILWIGFGLKPELTGKGLGKTFVTKGIEFGIEYFDYKGNYVMLAVAQFNIRAIKAYEGIGFSFVEKYMQKTNGGEYEFIRMKKVLTKGIMDFKYKLSKLLDDKSKNEEFSGVVLIKKGDQELFSGAYGYANRPWKVKNTLETRFRIASVSKLFTALAIFQLIEAGKISLDTKVVDYLNIKDSKIPKEVTVFHLLTHTSGIADYFDEMESEDEDWEKMWEEKPIYTMRGLADYFPMFAYKEPVNKLGEKFHYNGAGYILLGMIIEKASKLTYFDYVRRNIFSEIGMKNTNFLSLDEVHENVADGYEVVKDSNKQIIGWKKNIYTATPNAASDGGATSTASELIHFIQSIRKKELLSDKMTSEFLSPQVLDEGSNGARDYIWKYGFANWFILDNNGNVVRGGHTGEEYGVSCRLYYYPAFNIDVVILGNQGWCAGSLGWDIHDLILEMNK